MRTEVDAVKRQHATNDDDEGAGRRFILAPFSLLSCCNLVERLGGMAACSDGLAFCYGFGRTDVGYLEKSKILGE